jgi:hypothetical protein
MSNIKVALLDSYWWFQTLCPLKFSVKRKQLCVCGNQTTLKHEFICLSVKLFQSLQIMAKNSKNFQLLNISVKRALILVN